MFYVLVSLILNNSYGKFPYQWKQNIISNHLYISWRKMEQNQEEFLLLQNHDKK